MSHEETKAQDGAQSSAEVPVHGLALPAQGGLAVAESSPSGLPPADDPEVVMRVFQMATDMAVAMKIDGKAAVRRVVGTAAWKHDPERVAAARAKRERKAARRRA